MNTKDCLKKKYDMRVIDKFLKISFIIFGLFPLLPSKIKGTPVILLFIVTIYYVFNFGFKRIKIKEFLVLSGLFSINILSLINTFHFPLHKIETILSLLIIPFSYAVLKLEIKDKQKRGFIISFVVSSILLSIIHIIYFWKIGLFSEETLKVNSIRKAVFKMPFLNDHPIYISLFLALAILFIPWIYRKTVIKPKFKLLFLIGSVFCLVDLFLISSKGIIIALLVSLVVYSFITLKTYSKTLKYSVIIFIIASFFISIFYIPTLERRFRELNIKSTYNKIDPNNSTSIRLAVYNCVIETIKRKPFFGYGLGVSPQRECYKEVSSHLYKVNYNSHNQFLGYFLIAGVFGLLTLVLFLFYVFKISFAKKDYDFIIILMFFTIILFIENILERQSGVILFIFYSCFLMSEKKVEKTE